MFTPQDFCSMFDHFLTFRMKRLNGLKFLFLKKYFWQMFQKH